jgi:hypothetical protein
MNCRPREIGDAEAIARGICSPYHVTTNGKLKPAAYEPTPDTDEVSTMRVDWIGSDACKRHAKALEDPSHDKVYRGLAILSAGQIRQRGGAIIDTREQFVGHADIKLGITPRKGEPLPPEQLKEFRDRTKALANLANYFPDPKPTGDGWSGPPLRYKE